MAVLSPMTQPLDLNSSHAEESFRDLQMMRIPFQQLLTQSAENEILCKVKSGKKTVPNSTIAAKSRRKLLQANKIVPMASTSVQDLELRYGEDAQPIMLTAEDRRLLWSNAAFKRATAQAVMAGASGVLPPPGNDPLAHPIISALLLFYPGPLEPPCNSLLWTFDPFGGLEARYPGLRILHNSANLICPRPMRPIPSFVDLQQLKEVDAPSGPLRGTFESVQHNFEPLSRWSTPVVIVDTRFKVRWVNSAYKALTGQPRCAWMSTENGGSDRLTGEVSVRGSEEVPGTSTALIGSCNVSWVLEGCDAAKCTLSNVPAMGLRVESNGECPTTLGFVWHLDTAAAGVTLGN